MAASGLPRAGMTSPARPSDVGASCRHLCRWHSGLGAAAETWKRSRDVRETITTSLGPRSPAAAAAPALASGEFRAANSGVCPPWMLGTGVARGGLGGGRWRGHPGSVTVEDGPSRRCDRCEKEGGREGRHGRGGARGSSGVAAGSWGAGAGRTGPKSAG